MISDRRTARRLVATGCCAILLLGSVVLYAAGDIFTANFSASLFPVYGFSGAAPMTNAWSRQTLPGGGPNGADAVQLTQTPRSGWDFGWGHDLTNLARPAQGATRYLRWRMRFSADSNFLGVDQDGATLIPYSSGKLLMWPPGGGGAGQRACVL